MHDFDVIVAGGGPAGIMAALAAAKVGAKVLIIEQNGFLGGASTAMSTGPISPFHFGNEQVIKGIPQQFMDELVSAKGSTGHMKTLDPYGSGDSLGFFDREKYKLVAAMMLERAGVRMLFHSFISGVLVKDNTVTGVAVTNKSGNTTYSSAIVVDATGDGDVAVLAGAEYVKGENESGLMQPCSAMFEMANVDEAKLYKYILDHPEEFEWKTDVVPLRAYNARLKKDYFVVQGFKTLVQQAIDSGELQFGRNSLLMLNGVNQNSMHFNSTRVTGIDATDTEQLTKGELLGRKQIESVSEFCIKHVPGFEHSYVSRTSSYLGVRETRHIIGEYILNIQDVVEGRKFIDVVSRGYFPIDIHSYTGAQGYDEGGGKWVPLKDTYDIPYRSLVPKKIDGLILSGRAISGTSGAHGSYRTQGGIMGIGQASGIAAALCALSHVRPRDLDVKKLQQTLLSFGASVYRDPVAMEKEAANARMAVNDFLSTHKAFITDPSKIQ